MIPESFVVFFFAIVLAVNGKHFKLWGAIAFGFQAFQYYFALIVLLRMLPLKSGLDYLL